MSRYVVDQFVLDHIFHKIQPSGGEPPVYWRECIQSDGMKPDEVGYILVFCDGTSHHTYRHPPTIFS